MWRIWHWIWNITPLNLKYHKTKFDTHMFLKPVLVEGEGGLEVDVEITAFTP
jgi:hypothetical protein